MNKVTTQGTAAQIRQLSALTARLVKTGSISPSQGENRVAKLIVRTMQRGGFSIADPLTSDVLLSASTGLIPLPDGRANAFAFLPALERTDKTLLLFGHMDTVGIDDFGQLKGVANDPVKLRKALIEEGSEAEAIKDLLTGNWMCGRGSLDMKSGLAIEMTTLINLRSNPSNGNILFMGMPDEENDSAGMLGAVPFLKHFAELHQLNLMGAINADYTTERFPGDSNRYLYLGTVGKLLPTFLVIGSTTHVGEIFNGINPSLILAQLAAQMETNPAFCDTMEGETTLPPTALKFSDLKAGYNVQTPLSAWAYFNLFTHSMTPENAMQHILSIAREAAHRSQQILRARTRDFNVRTGSNHPDTQINISVLPFDELATGLTIDSSAAAIATDPRDKSRLIVEDLWRRSGRSLGRHEAVIIPFLSPPYYPHGHVSKEESAASSFISAATASAKRAGLAVRKFYPYISDASFLRAPMTGADMTSLLPLWEKGYRLPIEDIRALNLPVINLGPWGKGAHQRIERIETSYSFGRLPQIMEDVIRNTFR
ncbi:MAG: M20/M25/M40 family metallo-hydrolase [Candidatus Margulisiibacteriota bacterium]